MSRRARARSTGAQRSLHGLHHGRAIRRLSAQPSHLLAQRCLRILDVAGLVQLVIEAEPEASVAGIANQPILQLSLQSALGNQIANDTQLFAMGSQPAALLGVSRAAAAPAKAGRSITGSMAADGAAEPALLPPEPSSGERRAAMAADDSHGDDERATS